MNRTILTVIFPLILLAAIVTAPVTVTEDAFARYQRHTDSDLSQAASIINSCLNPASNSNTNDNMISNGNCGGTLSQQGGSGQSSAPTTVQNANPNIEVQRSTTTPTTSQPPSTPNPGLPPPLDSNIVRTTLFSTNGNATIEITDTTTHKSNTYFVNPAAQPPVVTDEFVIPPGHQFQVSLISAASGSSITALTIPRVPVNIACNNTNTACIGTMINSMVVLAVRVNAQTTATTQSPSTPNPGPSAGPLDRNIMDMSLNSNQGPATIDITDTTTHKLNNYFVNVDTVTDAFVIPPGDQVKVNLTSAASGSSIITVGGGANFTCNNMRTACVGTMVNSRVSLVITVINP